MKKFILAFVLLFGLVASSYAILWMPIVAGVVWIGQQVSSRLAVSTAIEASIYVHAGAIAAYSLFFADKSGGKAIGEPALEVKLNPEAARSNPDPTKFNDPAPGERDVTPKAELPFQSGQSYVYEFSTAYLQSLTPKQYYATQMEAALAEANAGGTTYDHPPYSAGSSCSPNGYGGYSCGVNGVGHSLSVQVSEYGHMKANGTCTDPGYTIVDGHCALTNAELVRKPETQPCEVLRTSSGLVLDAKNPNCLQSVTMNGSNGISMPNGQGITFNTDGSVSATDSGGTTTFQLGVPNANGSVPIIGASRGTGTGGGGTGTGGGGSGTGSGGSCGGVGQVPCKIDGSEVTGVDNNLTSGKAALNTALDAHKGFLDGLVNQGDHGVSFSFLPSLPACSCTVWTMNIAGRTSTIDPCPTMEKISEIGNYVFGIITLFLLFNIATKKPD